MPKTTIGVIGKGTLSSRMIRSIFADQLDTLKDAEDMRLVLPVTKALFTEEVEIVADWALANNVPFEVVHDGSKLPKATEEYVEAAVRESKVANVGTGIVKILEKADQHPRLFVFWDEEDEDGYEAFETAWDAEIGSYDLCNGLEELSFSDDEEGDAEPEEAGNVHPLDEDEDGNPRGNVHPTDEVEPKHDVDPKAELRRMTAKDLKAICAEKGITVSRSGKGRIAKDAYIDALAEYEATGATEFHQDEDRVKGVEEKAQEGLVSKDEAAVDLDAEEEPEVEDDGAIPETDEDDAPELPSDDDDEDVIEQRPGDLAVEGEYGVTSSSSGTTNPTQGQTTIVYHAPASAVQPFLTGACAGCGGPIFSDGATADFFHADKCPLA